MSPYAKAKPNISIYEWIDAFAVSKLERADREFCRTYEALIAHDKVNQIVESAREATNAAKSINSGPQPDLRDVRSLEKTLFRTESESSDNYSLSQIPIQGVEAHNELIRRLFSIANANDGGKNGD